MALYYNLPVYTSSYTLVNRLFECSSHFSREYKYTVGQQMKEEGIMLIKNIYRANSVVDKTVPIREARENVEMIRLFLRIMQDFDEKILGSLAVSPCCDKVKWMYPVGAQKK